MYAEEYALRCARKTRPTMLLQRRRRRVRVQKGVTHVIVEMFPPAVHNNNNNTITASFDLLQRILCSRYCDTRGYIMYPPAAARSVRIIIRIYFNIILYTRAERRPVIRTRTDAVYVRRTRHRFSSSTIRP